MIALIKADLLESDFSMCLGLLMSYKEPNDPMLILEHAQKVRQTLLHREPYTRVPSPEPPKADPASSESEEEETKTPNAFQNHSSITTKYGGQGATFNPLAAGANKPATAMSSS